MAQRGPQRPTARIEEAIGFVGAFGVLFLGVTVFCEVNGRPALGWAMVLLVCVLAVVGLDRWRRTVLRRGAGTGHVAEATHGGAGTGHVAEATHGGAGTGHVADATHGGDG